MVFRQLTQGRVSAIHVKADDSPGARVVVMNKAPFHIESASSGWTHVHGMSEAALRGRSLRVLEGPGTDMRVVHRLLDAVVRGVESQSSFLTYTAGGKCLWTHMMVAPLLSEANTIESFVAETSSYDVLELEEAMSQEEGFQLLVSLHDPNYCIVNASQSLCQLLRVSRDHLVGIPLSAVLASSASNQRVAEMVAAVVHGTILQQPGAHDIVLLSESEDKVVSLCIRPCAGRNVHICQIAPATDLNSLCLCFARSRLPPSACPQNARVAVTPVVSADFVAQHALLTLEPHDNCAADEEIEALRAKLAHVEQQLASANAAAATWRCRAEVGFLDQSLSRIIELFCVVCRAHFESRAEGSPIFPCSRPI